MLSNGDTKHAESVDYSLINFFSSFHYISSQNYKKLI